MKKLPFFYPQNHFIAQTLLLKKKDFPEQSFNEKTNEIDGK